MLSTQTLYRVPKSHFDRMESKEKIRLAEEHIQDLLKAPIEERDDYMIKELKDAIAHHEYLLNEE